MTAQTKPPDIWSPGEVLWFTHRAVIYYKQQDMKGGPVRTFYLNMEQRKTTKMVDSKRKPNLLVSTKLIYE